MLQSFVIKLPVLSTNMTLGISNFRDTRRSYILHVKINLKGWIFPFTPENHFEISSKKKNTLRGMLCWHRRRKQDLSVQALWRSEKHLQDNWTLLSNMDWSIHTKGKSFVQWNVHPKLLHIRRIRWLHHYWRQSTQNNSTAGYQTTY